MDANESLPSSHARGARVVAGAVAWLRAHAFDLLGCTLALLYALPSAFYPFGSDQGIHSYVGEALLRGELPYVSGIGGKPPGIFVAHALARLLFGHSQAAIRLLEIAAIPLLGWLVASCARLPSVPARDGQVGAASVLCAVANFSYHDYWETAHPEFWMTLALLAALHVALRDPRPLRRPWLTGLLCALAFSFKYTSAAIALPIAAVCGLRALLAADGCGSRRVLRGLSAVVLAAGLFLLGAALVFAVWVLPYVLTGTFEQMREVCWDMTMNYASRAPEPRRWSAPLLAVDGMGSLAALAAAAAGVGLLFTLVRRDWRALGLGLLHAVLIAAAIYSVVMQGRLFHYHWTAILAFLVLIVVWGLRQIDNPGWLELALVLGLGLALLGHPPRFVAKSPRSYLAQVSAVLALARGELTREQLTLSYQWRTPTDRYANIVRAGRRIRELARKGDTLCLNRFVSPLYQETGLRCPSRHAIGMFVGFGPPTWAQERRRDLARTPPTFMMTLKRLPGEIRQLQYGGYHEIGRFGTLVIFMRKELWLARQ